MSQCAVIDAAHTHAAENPVYGQAQPSRDFLLGAATLDLGREHGGVALADARSDRDGIASDPRRARFYTDDELGIERGWRGEDSAIDDGLVTNDRNRGSSQVRLSRTLVTAHQSIRAPSAHSESRRARCVHRNEPARTIRDLPVRLVRQSEFERELEGT